jgi:hypothetical protein
VSYCLNIVTAIVTIEVSHKGTKPPALARAQPRMPTHTLSLSLPSARLPDLSLHRTPSAATTSYSGRRRLGHPPPPPSNVTTSGLHRPGSLGSPPPWPPRATPTRGHPPPMTPTPLLRSRTRPLFLDDAGDPPQPLHVADLPDCAATSTLLPPGTTLPPPHQLLPTPLPNQHRQGDLIAPTS